MGRPKRAKPYNPAAPVHDRRSKDLLRNDEGVTAEITITDQYGDKITTLRRLRNDPLANLHARKAIDEAQYEAGRAFQSDFEAVERPAQAVDPSKPYVDCSRNPQPLSDSFSRSLVRLNVAHRELGIIGSALTHDVLIATMSYAEIAASRGLAGRRWEEYFGLRFRECLDCLTVVYGFAMEKRT